MVTLAAVILSGAFGLALWGAWRPRYRMLAYCVAGVVAVALISVLAITGQTDLLIVAAAELAALFIPLVVFNHRRAERGRSG